MHNLTSLVLNWHLTESCNYRCRYCYAIWEASIRHRELIRDPEHTAVFLRELYRFFGPGNSLNPLAKRLSWNAVRLNLAGGEPALHSRRLLSVANQARGQGFEVSLISNGSLLDHELMKRLAPLLNWLGISIDSAVAATNVEIGRVDRCGRLIDLNELVLNLEMARQSNPGLRIKINTVVNRLNHAEDLYSLIRNLYPDKWKVLRMLPVVNEHLAVTDEQFAAFIARHKPFANILRAENHQDMRESYLMIDPSGRFFQNSPIAGQGYAYSQPILEVGADAAFAQVHFAHERFSSRYALDVRGEAI
jgi:radical S-adenosyl methionine domain-containing protein 2